MKISQMKNLKVNYHLLEACNFGCKFCFARYAQKFPLSFEHMKNAVEKVAASRIFSGINFAGGEPFLIEQLPELIDFAKKSGLKTSVITNGSLLTNEILDFVLPNLDCIGISFHSICDETKKKIGSCSNNGAVLTNERLFDICQYIREHSDCKIKLNTVVNSYNKNELISGFVKNLCLDRWKILRCQSFACNDDMLVNDKEWSDFCLRNGDVDTAVFEDNMKDTYIMINPAGFLIKQSPDEKSYTSIGSVLESDMKELLLQHPLHIDEYKMRYEKSA